MGSEQQNHDLWGWGSWAKDPAAVNLSHIDDRSVPMLSSTKSSTKPSVTATAQLGKGSKDDKVMLGIILYQDQKKGPWSPIRGPCWEIRYDCTQLDVFPNTIFLTARRWLGFKKCYIFAMHGMVLKIGTGIRVSRCVDSVFSLLIFFLKKKILARRVQ